MTPDLNPVNTYGRFWTDVLDCTVHHHHQNTKCVNIFWKNGVHPSRRVPETCRINAKVHWSCPKTLQNAKMLILPVHNLSTLQLIHFSITVHLPTTALYLILLFYIQFYIHCIILFLYFNFLTSILMSYVLDSFFYLREFLLFILFEHCWREPEN